MIKKILHTLWWETFQNATLGMLIGYFIWRKIELNPSLVLGIFIIGALGGLLVLLTENTKIKVLPGSPRDEMTVKGTISMTLTFGVAAVGICWTLLEIPWLYNPFVISILIGLFITIGEWPNANKESNKFLWILHGVGMFLGSYIVIKWLPTQNLGLTVYMGRLFLGILIMSSIICAFDYWPHIVKARE